MDVFYKALQKTGRKGIKHHPLQQHNGQVLKQLGKRRPELSFYDTEEMRRGGKTKLT